jgi:hypothetical protein
MLTGALVGAQVGLSGIPERFIEGLTAGTEIVELAQRLHIHTDDAGKTLKLETVPTSTRLLKKETRWQENSYTLNH